jgi:large subunit ribosomal protein L28
MSRICILTGKRANTANRRSHSNRATKRLQEVNLQSRRMGGIKVKLSTAALKTLKKLQSMEKGERLTKKQKKQAKTAARKTQVKK